MKPWYSTLFTNGIIFGSSLAGGVLSARYLGVENRGILAAIIYWPHFIAGIASLGLNEGIVISTAKSGSTATLRTTTFALSIVLSCIVGTIGLLSMPLLLGENRQDYLYFAQIYLLLFLPFTFLAQNFLAIDQGELSFRRFNTQRILEAVAYPLLLLVFWYTGHLTVTNAAISILSGTAIIAIMRVWNVKSSLLKYPSWKEAKRLLSISIRIHLVNLVGIISAQVDKMVLVLFASNIELGLYVVATTAAGSVIALFTQTYINIMLPTAAQYKNATDSIQEVIPPLRLLIGIIILSTVLLAFVIPFLIRLVYGIEFIMAGSYAQILLFAFALVGIKKALVYLLRAWKKNRPAVYGESLTALVLVSGANLSIQNWGTTGLCTLVVLSHATGTLLISYFFLKETNLSIKQLIKM